MAKKVVAHFIDHSVVKGTSLDVEPDKPLCHVQTSDQGTVEVELRNLKALYFVKDFGGDADYRERQEPQDGDIRLRGSRQIEVTFQDGERLGGLTNRFPPTGPFFFVLPMDPKSNNVRILVNREAVARITEKAAPEPPPPAAAPRSKRTSWVFDGKGIKHINPEA